VVINVLRQEKGYGDKKLRSLSTIFLTEAGLRHLWKVWISCWRSFIKAARAYCGLQTWQW